MLEEVFFVINDDVAHYKRLLHWLNNWMLVKHTIEKKNNFFICNDKQGQNLILLWCSESLKYHI